MTDLLLLTLRWKYAYWILFEAKPQLMVGFAGLGGRAGGRIPLSRDRRHEVRIGLGVAGGIFRTRTTGFFARGPILTPRVQHVYNTKHGTVGVGLDVPVGIGVYASGGTSWDRWRTSVGPCADLRRPST